MSRLMLNNLSNFKNFIVMSYYIPDNVLRVGAFARTDMLSREYDNFLPRDNLNEILTVLCTD